MDTTQIVTDVLPAVTSIMEAIGFPAIVAAVAAKILSRGETKVSEEVLADLNDAGKGWSFVRHYESNRAMLRDRALKRIVLLRDSCAGGLRGSEDSSKEGSKRGGDGGIAGTTAGGSGGDKARPAHMGKTHKRIFVAICILFAFLLVALVASLSMQIWKILFGDIATEGWLSVFKCTVEHPELWLIGIVSIALLVVSLTIKCVTSGERKYLNEKMHSLLPVLTAVILVLAFVIGAFLPLGPVVAKDSVPALGWWYIVPLSLALVTLALVLVYTVVVRNVSEEYAIRETCREKFFTGLLDRDALISVYISIERFKGLMTASEIVFMETALMAGWSVMSIVLVTVTAASA